MKQKALNPKTKAEKHKERLEKIKRNLPSIYTPIIIERLEKKHGYAYSESIIKKVLAGERTNYRILNELALLAQENKKDKEKFARIVNTL